MEQTIIFETPRLTLRQLREEDFSALCAIWQDIDVMYAWEHTFTDDEVREWTQKNIMRYMQEGYSYWAVLLRESGQLIGVCGLLREQAGLEEHIGLGYLFAKAVWHQGYALEAAMGCLRYAVRLGMRELTAQIRPENTASRRVAERLGMQVRGEFVKHYRGKEMPHLLYHMEISSEK